MGRAAPRPAAAVADCCVSASRATNSATWPPPPWPTRREPTSPGWCSSRPAGPRRRSGITEKIVTQIQNMKDLNMGFDCSAGDFKSAAATMDDLANIIQDVGIVNLKNQLGLDLDFAVLGQY